MKIDLHLHSHVSDGDLPPATVVRAAATAGLDLIALTDHDTAAGIPEAAEAARALGIGFVPGIEISTRWHEHELHILGYWIDPEAPPILAHQETSEVRRVRRMERMIERLQGLGVSISLEEVLSAAGPETRSIGRPHLARALLAGGHTRHYGEAFARYISDRGPAFVAEDFPSPGDAVALIHAAGGVAIWAHPPLDLFADALEHFLPLGLDGLECYRPNLSAEETLLLARSAAELGLLATGGSDWHGPRRTDVGDFYVRPEQLSAFLARGGIAAG